MERRFLILILALLLSSCGGGGGGGGTFSNSSTSPGYISIDRSRSSIDTGEFVEIVVDIEEVNDLGVIIKVRYPAGLTYQLDSSYLTVDGIKSNVGPAVNGADGTNEFLAYFFSRVLFGKEGRGRLIFLLKGISSVDNGEIGADIDIDDPETSNSTEFTVRNPGYSAEDSIGIDVNED